MSTSYFLVLGLLLGMKHAAEADHLTAVAALTTGQSSLAESMKLGITWGVGHTLTLMLFGGVVLWLGTNIPPRMEQTLELAVSVMLMALGIDVLRQLLPRRIHVHVHRHDSAVKHVHAHSHAGMDGRARPKHHQHKHPHAPALRALAVGMMHGMAGSAALVALSLGAVSSWFMGLVYIAIFGLGSIVGMAVLSVAITIPMRYSAMHLGRLHNSMTALVGGFSCTLGAFIFYRIGVTEGLLFH